MSSLNKTIISIRYCTKYRFMFFGFSTTTSAVHRLLLPNIAAFPSKTLQVFYSLPVFVILRSLICSHQFSFSLLKGGTFKIKLDATTACCHLIKCVVRVVGERLTRQVQLTGRGRQHTLWRSGSTKRLFSLNHVRF